MKNALILSCTEKSTTFFTEMLATASIKQIAVIDSAGEARRILLERDFDLVIINSPLKDETGEKLSRHIISKCNSQVILIVKHEHFEAVSAVCENDGILTIAKPMNKATFWSALMLAKSTVNRIKHIQVENTLLKQKIEDINVINRAKCTLISYLNMGESEAHRYIEKQSMDMRTTKRAVAEGILKTYEN